MYTFICILIVYISPDNSDVPEQAGGCGLTSAAQCGTLQAEGGDAYDTH